MHCVMDILLSLVGAMKENIYFNIAVLSNSITG